MEIADRPCSFLKEDNLDRGSLVDILCDLVCEEHIDGWRSTEMVVGLVGPWGSGKSTILNFVAENLERRNDVYVIRFNPWLMHGRDDLIGNYFQELTKKLGKSKSEHVRKIANEIFEYKDIVSGVAQFVFPPAGLISKIPIIKKSTLDEKRRTIEQKLSSLNGSIVVIIDELDRAEDHDVRELARFVKAVGDLPSISYLIGYDHVRVQKALSLSGDVSEGEDYLRKIVQINIPIRPLFEDEVVKFLTSSLPEDFKVFAENFSEEWSEALRKVSFLIETPREMKRLVASTRAFWRGVGAEIYPIDLFYFSSISAFSTDLQDWLIRNFDAIVDDPVNFNIELERMFGKERKIDEWESVGFNAQRFGKLKDLIGEMFPRLSRRDVKDHFGRISKRSNFLRLIYFGDPPFRLSRASLIDFWIEPTEDKLVKFSESGRLEAFVAGFERLLPELPCETDTDALEAMRRFVFSQSESGDDHRAFADEMRWGFIRASIKDPSQLQRIANMLGYLRGVGDMVFLPDLVRHHMFSYGLADKFARRDYPTIWSETEFKDVFYGETERYLEAILDGTWSNKFLTSDPLYAALQSGRYSDSHRGALSLYVRDPSAAESLSELLLPAGTTLEKETLEELVDGQLFKEGIEALAASKYIGGASSERILSLLSSPTLDPPPKPA